MKQEELSFDEAKELVDKAISRIPALEISAFNSHIIENHFND
jgi:hypothetical protein